MSPGKLIVFVSCLLFTCQGYTLENSSVQSLYEERSKIFDLMFPEEKEDVVESPLYGLDLIQQDRLPQHIFFCNGWK